MGDEETKKLDAISLIDDEIIPELLQYIVEIDFKFDVEMGHVIGIEYFKEEDVRHNLKKILLRK